MHRRPLGLRRGARGRAADRIPEGRRRRNWTRAPERSGPSPPQPPGPHADDLLGPGPAAETIREAIRRAAMAPYPSSSRGRAAQARSSSRAPFIPAAFGGLVASARSTARRSPTICWKRNCSGTRVVRLRAPSPSAPASSRRRSGHALPGRGCRALGARASEAAARTAGGRSSESRGERRPQSRRADRGRDESLAAAGGGRRAIQGRPAFPARRHPDRRSTAARTARRGSVAGYHALGRRRAAGRHTSNAVSGSRRRARPVRLAGQRARAAERHRGALGARAETRSRRDHPVAASRRRTRGARDHQLRRGAPRVRTAIRSRGPGTQRRTQGCGRVSARREPARTREDDEAAGDLQIRSEPEQIRYCGDATMAIQCESGLTARRVAPCRPRRSRAVTSIHPLPPRRQANR